MRSRVLAAALAACVAMSCGAQSLRVDGACVLAAPRDTIDAIMTASVHAFDPRQRVPPEYVLVLAQEIARYMQVPPGIRLTAFTTTRADSSIVYPAEAMMAELTLDRSGGIVHVGPASQSLSPAFDSLVLAAVARAGAESAFPPPPGRARGDTLSFRVVVSVGEGIARGEMLIARMRSPAWRLSRHVMPLPPYPRPRYPEAMQRSNVQGEVVLEFVVGTDSVPVWPTVRVVRHTDASFWEEVRKVLHETRVAPAMVGECPIPQRVRQPFHFLLR